MQLLVSLGGLAYATVATINDGVGTATTTYSGTRIDTLIGAVSTDLANHIADTSVHFVINDAGAAANEAWSSTKITTELAAKVGYTLSQNLDFNNFAANNTASLHGINQASLPPVSPAGQYRLVMEDSKLKLSVNGGPYTEVGTGSGGHTIQDDGTPVTQRPNLNFTGPGVTLSDDNGNDATVVTIANGPGSGNIGGTIAANQVAVGTASDTIGGFSSLVFEGGSGTLTTTHLVQQDARAKHTQPVFLLEESPAAANEGKWRHTAAGGTYSFQMVDDAETGFTNVFTVERTGGTL